MKLGKQPYKYDPKTLRLSNFMKLPELTIPPTFNIDAGKVDFPTDPWGNNEYGDCVFAGRANHELRLEYVEQEQLIPLTSDVVVGSYKAATGCQSPGDANDQGFVILELLKEWRASGWQIGSENYNIYAFGELAPKDHTQLEAAIAYLGGVLFGFALPRAIHGQSSWDFNATTDIGPEWAVGSWGGHCVYGKAYDEQGIIVKSWGQDIKVSYAFIDEFCDEAWAVVDNKDSWLVKSAVDTNLLDEELTSIIGEPPTNA